MGGILAGLGPYGSSTANTFDYTSPGSGTLTIPAGYTTCVVQVWGFEFLNYLNQNLLHL